jgi:hypothetical protein
MSPLPTVTYASRVIVSRNETRVRGAGKANTSRTLDGEWSSEAPFGPRPQVVPSTTNLSRTGTYRDAPNWNGSPLQPAFVAQVLGQVLMDPRARALSLAPVAYGREAPQIPHGSFFNNDV